MRTIEKSVEIDAPPASVWAALTNSRLVSRWANAFLEGLTCDSRWKTGDKLLWKEKDGAVVMHGKIVTADPERRLEVCFPPELNLACEGMDPEFSETYAIEPQEEGVRLSIVCGPVHLVDLDTLDPKWDEALATIKELAEAPDRRSRSKRAESEERDASPA